MKTTILDSTFVSEVDGVDEREWCDILAQFDDANIYQTWTYDEVRAGRKNISQLVLRKDGEIVAAAQVRIMRLPVLNAGIAYIRWGPMFRKRKSEVRPEIFRQALRALRNEFACKRGLVLRLYPIAFRDEMPEISAMLAEEGFNAVSAERIDRTLRLDLRLSPEELRTGMRQHWRRYLKVAEKNGLEIVEGTDDSLFEGFIKIYKQLVSRKKFAEPNNIDDFRSIQSKLPVGLKMRIMLCKVGGEVCAGLVCSAIGSTVIYLFGATSDAGLNHRGSYLLHWRMIEWAKQNGFTIYDLHGIDPVLNPGTYKFKADLCGNNGRDVYFLGRFDSKGSFLSNCFVELGERVRRFRRSTTPRINSQTSPTVGESTLNG